jgi:hypothetical protein
MSKLVIRLILQISTFFDLIRFVNEGRIFMNEENLRAKIINIFDTLYPKNNNNQTCIFTNIEFTKFELKKNNDNLFSFEFKTNWKELDNLENKCETETITGIIKYSENSNYEKINIKFDENSTFKNLGIHEKIKIKK